MTNREMKGPAFVGPFSSPPGAIILTHAVNSKIRNGVKSSVDIRRVARSVYGIDGGWISEGREVPFETDSRSSTSSTGRESNEKGPSRHPKGTADSIPYTLL